MIFAGFKSIYGKFKKIKIKTTGLILKLKSYLNSKLESMELQALNYMRCYIHIQILLYIFYIPLMLVSHVHF